MISSRTGRGKWDGAARLLVTRSLRSLVTLASLAKLLGRYAPSFISSLRSPVTLASLALLIGRYAPSFRSLRSRFYSVATLPRFARFARFSGTRSLRSLVALAPLRFPAALRSSARPLRLRFAPPCFPPVAPPLLGVGLFGFCSPCAAPRRLCRPALRCGGAPWVGSAARGRVSLRSPLRAAPLARPSRSLRSLSGAFGPPPS